MGQELRGVTFSADGSRLVASTASGLVFWDLDTPRATDVYHAADRIAWDGINADRLALSPDGERAAIANGNRIQFISAKGVNRP
jgi:hypothetical protein